MKYTTIVAAAVPALFLLGCTDTKTAPTATTTTTTTGQPPVFNFTYGAN